MLLRRLKALSKILINIRISQRANERVRGCCQPLAELISGYRLKNMNKTSGALRRAGLYAILSYMGLTLINNSGLDLPNMWLAYLPMFIAVYAFTQWADRSWTARSRKWNNFENGALIWKQCIKLPKSDKRLQNPDNQDSSAMLIL